MPMSAQSRSGLADSRVRRPRRVLAALPVPECALGRNWGGWSRRRRLVHRASRRVVDGVDVDVGRLADGRHSRHASRSGPVSSGGRPPCRPRARAAANPAWARSWMSSRSNSARAPNTWKIKRPPADVVSMFSVSERNPTPCFPSSFMESIRCLSDRPSRSRRQTTNVSPGRSWSFNLSSSGRCAAAPGITSVKIRKQPASLSALVCKAASWSLVDTLAYPRSSPTIKNVSKLNHPRGYDT